MKDKLKKEGYFYDEKFNVNFFEFTEDHIKNLVGKRNEIDTYQSSIHKDEFIYQLQFYWNKGVFFSTIGFLPQILRTIIK